MCTYLYIRVYILYIYIIYIQYYIYIYIYIYIYTIAGVLLRPVWWDVVMQRLKRQPALPASNEEE